MLRKIKWELPCSKLIVHADKVTKIRVESLGNKEEAAHDSEQLKREELQFELQVRFPRLMCWGKVCCLLSCCAHMWGGGEGDFADVS